MKRFKQYLEEEKKGINTKTVPVYNNSSEWKVLGHVHKSSTSKGAAKVSKTPYAEYTTKGPHGGGWVGKESLKEKEEPKISYQAHSDFGFSGKKKVKQRKSPSSGGGNGGSGNGSGGGGGAGGGSNGGGA